MNFILRDNQNEVYQTFWGESEERELLISKNISKIYKILKKNININDVSPDFDPVKYLGPDWKIDQGLYDKLVIDFNNQGGEILSAWNPNR